MADKGYNVYVNDKFIKFVSGRNLVTRKSVVANTRIGTHMGQWSRVLTVTPENITKTTYEYEYSTTVGIYIKFSPALGGN